MFFVESPWCLDVFSPFCCGLNHCFEPFEPFEPCGWKGPRPTLFVQDHRPRGGRKDLLRGLGSVAKHWAWCLNRKRCVVPSWMIFWLVAWNICIGTNVWEYMGLTTKQGIYGNMWEQMFLEHDFSNHTPN